MTKLYFILIFLILGLSSCSEDEIDTYDSFNYLSFVTNDTIEVSFLMLGKDEYDCPIEVRHTGLPSYAEYKDFKVKGWWKKTRRCRGVILQYRQHLLFNQ